MVPGDLEKFRKGVEDLLNKLKERGISLNDLIFPEHCFRKHTWRLYKDANEEYQVLPPITLFEYFIEHGNNFDIEVCGKCYFHTQCQEYRDKTGYLLPSERDKREIRKGIKKMIEEVKVMITNKYLVIYWEQKLDGTGKGTVKFCKENTNQYIWLSKKEALQVYARAKKENKKNLMILKRVVSVERR